MSGEKDTDIYRSIKDYIRQLPPCSRHPFYMEESEDGSRLRVFLCEEDAFDENQRMMSFSRYNIKDHYTKEADLVYYLYVVFNSKARFCSSNVNYSEHYDRKERARKLYEARYPR